MTIHTRQEMFARHKELYDENVAGFIDELIRIHLMGTSILQGVPSDDTLAHAALVELCATATEFAARALSIPPGDVLSHTKLAFESVEKIRTTCESSQPL